MSLLQTINARVEMLAEGISPEMVERVVMQAREYVDSNADSLVRLKAVLKVLKDQEVEGDRLQLAQQIIDYSARTLLWNKD